jgi:hypothetical protein
VALPWRARGRSSYRNPLTIGRGQKLTVGHDKADCRHSLCSIPDKAHGGRMAWERATKFVFGILVGLALIGVASDASAATVTFSNGFEGIGPYMYKRVNGRRQASWPATSVCPLFSGPGKR